MQIKIKGVPFRIWAPSFVVLGVIAWWIYIFAAPPWFWITYNSLEISDSVKGGSSPTVTRDLVYHQSVLVEWDRTLYHNIGDDDWEPICEDEGKGNRYPGYVSSVTSVANFMGLRPCAVDLPEGEYYIEDNLQWSDPLPRYVSVESETFDIDASVEAPPNPAPIHRKPVFIPPPAPTPAPAPIRHIHKHPPPRDLLHAIFPFLK
jgi:hypothetical protein